MLHFLAKNLSSIWSRFVPRYVCGVCVVESDPRTGVAPSTLIFPHTAIPSMLHAYHHQHCKILAVYIIINNKLKNVFWEDINNSCVHNDSKSKLNIGLPSNIQLRIFGLLILK